jgi:hypothetical protein
VAATSVKAKLENLSGGKSDPLRLAKILQEEDFNAGTCGRL